MIELQASIQFLADSDTSAGFTATNGRFSQHQGKRQQEEAFSSENIFFTNISTNRGTSQTWGMSQTWEYDIAPAVWRNDSQRHVEHLPCCLLKKTFKWWKTLTQEFHVNGQTVLLLKYRCFFTILYQSLTEIRPDTALLHYWSWCWVAETWNVIKSNFWNFWWFNNFVFTQSDYIIIHLKHSRSCYMRQEQIPNHCIVVRNQQNSQ